MVLPRAASRKPGLLLGLALAVLAGCGGGGSEAPAERALAGPGFVFSAPRDWKVERTERSVAAHPQAAGPELVSVTVFRLSKPFRPARWPGAVRELDRVAATLARRLGGEVAARETVAISGRRARRYELEYPSGGRNLGQRLVFVLEGRREYQLLCRYPAPPSGPVADACDRLGESFRPR